MILKRFQSVLLGRLRAPRVACACALDVVCNVWSEACGHKSRVRPDMYCTGTKSPPRTAHSIDTYATTRMVTRMVTRTDILTHGGRWNHTIPTVASLGRCYRHPPLTSGHLPLSTHHSSPPPSPIPIRNTTVHH